MYKKPFCDIENIIKKNSGLRGMDKIKFSDELQEAANELYSSTTVLIVTGFAIKDMLTGETDGPIGAVSLASALEQLGKKVVIVTDRFSEKIMLNCCVIKGLKSPIEIYPFENPKEFSADLLQKYKPSHVIAIERPGRAKDGHCYSMRGEDISSVVPDTDVLFQMSKDAGIVTISVGDGGNEVGMGKASFLIRSYVKNGERICASFSSDYLIVTGISNWGGHALAAALSLLSKTMLLYDVNTEKKLIKGIVEAGAVDGCTKRHELTVDGYNLTENINVFNCIRNIVKEAVSATA